MVEKAKQAKAFVQRKISWLTGSNNESATRASLARLRRGIGKTPGSMPELWETTLKDLSPNLMGDGEAPSRVEWAVHTALTLYALHQQGKDLKLQCMSQKGESLGTALRKLIGNDEEVEKRIKRRFDATLTAASMEELSHHLRGLIQLLKAKSLPMDYPALTEDLYWLQFPSANDSVRLRWGRDFYRPLSGESENETNSSGKEDE